jgi:hypothetical protein
MRRVFHPTLIEPFPVRPFSLPVPPEYFQVPSSVTSFALAVTLPSKQRHAAAAALIALDAA